MERFIVGTGRCGSTLLSKMLAVSPEMVSIFEFFNGLHGTGRFDLDSVTGEDLWHAVTQPHAFVTMATSRGYAVEEVAYPFERPGARFSRSDYLPWLLVATLPRVSDDPDRLFEEAGEFVRAQPEQPRARHYSDLFDWLAAKSGATMWNERSGSGIDYTGNLVKLWPDARFLHLHRAGEEAALSMREHALFRLAISVVFQLDSEVDVATALAHAVPEPGKPDPLAAFFERRPPPEYFGRFWADQLSAGYRAVKNLRPEQYLEVAFEDLVGAPTETLRRIATFFEMDPTVGDWIPKAASMVRSVPPPRLPTLSRDDAERLIAECRTGNRLLERSDRPEVAGPAVRRHGEEARASGDRG